ncbi:MAG: L-histidine N(alpha)-methyltransferase [Acidobacteria bacterium]|nr:L-histidine N(alpha)-methyltransferase [Acidobacteriota bacterium]
MPAGARSRADDRRRAAVEEFASDVRYYVTRRPRQLPSKYLYDDLGSALFETITLLPWYRLARAEMRLIGAHGREILASLGAPAATIVELGPGNGTKLATLLAARDSGSPSLSVHLIDVSPRALTRAVRTVREAAQAEVVSHEATYEDGLLELAQAFGASHRTLVVFFGSNIGNFDPPAAAAFLRLIRAVLRPGDALLLGADLVKEERRLLLAYDDPLGVTAAFNRNLLVRLNRELGAAIDLPAFGHRAAWNREASRVEMHLVCDRGCRLAIPVAGVDLALAPGETLWTESSYKYEVSGLQRALIQAGFERGPVWIDDADRFALMLAQAGG